MEAFVEHAMPAAWTVKRGLETYLAENGFSEAEYEAPWTSASFFGLPIKVPNTRAHARAIRLHDLHHVATGFGTDEVGEAEVSAWELSRGLRPTGLYVSAIVLLGALMGLVIANQRVRRAYRIAPQGGCLWHELRTPYETLLSLTIGELREKLGLPLEGIAEGPRRRHARAPGTWSHRGSVDSRSTRSPRAAASAANRSATLQPRS